MRKKISFIAIIFLRIYGASTMGFERIHVLSRDEYQVDQEPSAFEWRGLHFKITRILDMWLEARMDPTRSPFRCFKVLTDGGRVFTLRFHEHFRTWSLLVPSEEPDG